MNAHEGISTLRGELHRALTVLKRLEEYFISFQKNRLGKTPGADEAMIVTQALSNYYTCLETVFFRISQFFENNLEPDRWHQSLLDKMMIEIPDYRPAVLSEATHMILVEFLKFRHFSRYYFELDYDWDKLWYLINKFNNVHDAIKKELRVFDSFLATLAKENDSEKEE